MLKMNWILSLKQGRRTRDVRDKGQGMSGTKDKGRAGQRKRDVRDVGQGMTGASKDVAN